MLELSLIKQLATLTAQEGVYVRTDPEIIDISDSDFGFELSIFAKNFFVKIYINKTNFIDVHCALKIVLFDKKTKIFCWNIKNYFSLYKKITKKNLEIQSNIFDLKILERFSGSYEKPAPSNFAEALNRFLHIYKNEWERIKDVYKDIYLPLITKVVPSIENKGLADRSTKNIKYCYYEIEGQENGRFSSYGCYKNCFLPLNLKKEEKQNLYSTNTEEYFILFDYKNMEVSVLEYLTKDKNLKNFLNDGEDFYETLYKKIINPNNFDEKKRNIMKMIFLPFVYGAGNLKISETTKIPIEKIEIITKRIKETFPHTFEWLNEYAENTVSNFYVNMFGKKRFIKEKYKSINFIVQSTASIFCIDKLIDLYNVFQNDVCFYIHDAYCLTSKKKDIIKKVELAKNILIQESKFLNNIHLNVSCKYGRNLLQMENFDYREESIERDLQQLSNNR